MATALNKRARRKRREAQHGQASQGVLRMSGVDWLESDPVSSSTQDGVLVAAVALAPAAMSGTHLAAIANAYERFRFVSLAVETSSRMPSTVSGGYIAGVSVDADPPPLIGTALKRYVRSLSGAVTAPWNQGRTFRHVKAPDESWYYVQGGAPTQGMARAEVVQGTILVVVDGAPANLVGTASISLTLKWTIELRDPAVPDISAITSWIIPPGTKLVPDGDGSIHADDGPFSEFWMQSHFDVVYVVTPPLAQGETTQVVVNYFKSHQNRDSTRSITTWGSFEKAVAAREPETNRHGDVTLQGGTTTHGFRILALGATSLNSGGLSLLRRWRTSLQLGPEIPGPNCI